MARTIVSPTVALTLDEVIARLSGKPAVDGILLVGSTGNGAVTPASDYDLLVVLSDMPFPLRVVLTRVDRRLTDVVFSSVSAIDRITTSKDLVASDDDDDRLFHWLESGRIAYDRSGRLGRAQTKVRLGGWVTPNRANEVYWTAHDPRYLGQIRQCVGETDLQRKVEA